MAEPNVFTRRQILIIGGVLAAAATFEAFRRERLESKRDKPAASGQRAACVLAPEQTEGPFYVDNRLIRRDITDGRPGVPLELRLRVVQADGCKPIPRATVEVWHADAAGAYSGVDGDDSQFLRGGQRTAGGGVATFQTIYPGWYPGRAPHIHVKVHVGGDQVHTGQLYFDEGASDGVYSRAPYDERGQRDTRNATDAIYADGGRQSTLRLTRSGEGYIGRLDLGVAR